LNPQRRNRGEAGDAVFLYGRDHVSRNEVVDEGYAGTGMKSRRQLAESRVEAERQRGQDAVLRTVLQILRHAACTGNHVAM
jgi:hypothetical protein